MIIDTNKVTAEYEDAITRLSVERTNQRFLNDSREQADLLIKLMVGDAKPDDAICIYANLQNSSFGKALSNTNAKIIRIIIDNQADEEIIKKLPNDVQKRIDYRPLNADRETYFFVSGYSFRLELECATGVDKAVSNFCDVEAVERLMERFERLWLSNDAIHCAPALVKLNSFLE